MTVAAGGHRAEVERCRSGHNRWRDCTRQVLRIDRRVQDKVRRVVVRILRAAVRTPRQPLVGLLIRPGHRRENRSFLERRARTQADLIHDDVCGRGDRDAAIIGDAGAVRRIARDTSGYPDAPEFVNR